MKGIRIGRRRARANELTSSPLELALTPALTDDRWHVPDRFNFARDVVEVLAGDPKRRAMTFLGKDGVIEPRSFMQMAEGAARWASIIREHDVQPGDRVIVLAGSGADWLEIILGAMKVGAVTVPCSPTLATAELESRVSSTEPALVVAEQSCQDTIEQMSLAPEVRYVDEGRRRRATDAPQDAPTHDTSSRDLAFILFTPGTSGEPKQVAHTHGSVFAARVAAEHWLDAGRGDAVWCTAPPDSASAVWGALIGPWSRGAEVVLHQGEFDPLERLDLLFRLSPTILCQSPAEYRALAELRELERFRSQRLRRLVSTGDYLDPELITAFEERWGLTIHDGYAQAETNAVVANGAEEGFKPGSLGRPVPGHHVAIIDRDGSELPVGIEGDLAVRGRPPTLFAGYWEAPDETKNAFRGDWYVTGDVAIADEDGFLWFVGRADDVISSRGRTFGPYEVERVLREHDAIAESAVIGLRDLQRGGQFIRAYVVPSRESEGSEQLEAELRQFVGMALPEQQVPREIVFVDELPTIGGKISRNALRQRPIGGRPLWELPPTSEHGPPVTAEPASNLLVVAEAAAVIEPAPPAPPAPRAPRPVVLPVEVSEPVTEVASIRAPDPTPLVPPTPEPVVEREPEQVAEAAPAFEPAPEPEPEPTPLVPPTPEPVVEREREQVAEAAPAFEPAPEPEPEPTPLVPPTPEPVVEREPEQVAEAAPAFEPEPDRSSPPEPDPALEPVGLSEPERVSEAARELEPEREPEPEPTPAWPEPEHEPIAATPPSHRPEHRPEFSVILEPEPEPVPDVAVERAPESEPAEPPARALDPVVAAASEPLPAFIVPPDAASDQAPPPPPAPDPEPELGPLPDYIVDPSRASEPAPRVAEPERRVSPTPLFEAESKPDPPRAPDPEPELGPLPDYIVDPGRASEPAPRINEPERPVTPTPLFDAASEPDPPPPAALYFPPTASFPAPREDDEDERARRGDTPRAPRQPPVPGQGRSKRSKSDPAEPADEVEEVTWMEGLSSRLSAYSLDDKKSDSGDEPGTGKLEDAETGS